MRGGFRAALWRKRSRRFRAGLLALVIGILFAFPFYWVIVTSLSSTNSVYQFPPNFLPGTVVHNYSRAWSEATWVRFFVNTLFIAGATVALVLVTSLLAGFALGVTRFRGREAVFFAVLSILMIPKVVLLIPDYVVLSKLHWLDTYQAQIVPWGASVFGIFLLRQFFRSLPQEIVEAAELDGVEVRLPPAGVECLGDAARVVQARGGPAVHRPVEVPDENRGRRRAAHPFVAPVVALAPSTSRRWASMNTTMIGSVVKTTAAESPVQSVPFVPKKVDRPTSIGCTWGLLVMMNGQRKLFHDAMKM